MRGSASYGATQHTRSKHRQEEEEHDNGRATQHTQRGEGWGGGVDGHARWVFARYVHPIVRRSTRSIHTAKIGRRRRRHRTVVVLIALKVKGFGNTDIASTSSSLISRTTGDREFVSNKTAGVSLSVDG